LQTVDDVRKGSWSHYCSYILLKAIKSW